MSSNPTSPSLHRPASSPEKPGASRFFYTITAVLLLVLMLAGFQDFYFRGQSYPARPTPPPIKLPVILHGTAMALWVVLFIIQTALIAGRSYKLHMRLGMLGAVLAAAVVVLGMWLAIAATRIGPAEMRIWGLSPRQFFAVPCSGMLMFSVFVALGVKYRKKPVIHKPMMLLASLAAIPAAIARITPVNNLYAGTQWEAIFGPFLGMIVFGTLLLIVKTVLTRSVDRWFAGGFAVLAVACVLTMRVATTPAWQALADWVVG
jgi:hypothetical protein